MRNTCCSILSGPDTSTQTGGKVDANQIVSASFVCFFGDASAVGTIKIQVSNDPTNSSNLAIDFTPVNWVDSGVSASITGGASALLTIANMNFRWIRAVYTSASGGSSTVGVNMNALSI